jgi:hypothetical protein
MGSLLGDRWAAAKLFAVRTAGTFPDLADVPVPRAYCAYDLAPQGGFPASVRVQPDPGKLPVPVLGVICQDAPGSVP